MSTSAAAAGGTPREPSPSLRVIAREGTRIGCIGFGGPPAHIALLRDLCVERRRWLSPGEFEDAIATTNLLPGPGSTQLAIFCAWRLGGTAGAFVGGAGFIPPGLVVIILLSAVFLAGAPPPWVLGAGAGTAPRWLPWRCRPAARCCVRGGSGWPEHSQARWLAYGGGFVIIPLMQADAVGQYHWMTSAEFLNAVALGQVTPGPLVHTVAVVGYGAAGVGGALLAAAVAFAPSFSFILMGADRFDRLRRNARVRAFLDGAGPAAIGAILGSAIQRAQALRGLPSIRAEMPGFG